MESAPKEVEAIMFLSNKEIKSPKYYLHKQITMLKSLESSMKHTIDISTSWALYLFSRFKLFHYRFQHIHLLQPIQFGVSHFHQPFFTVFFRKENTSTFLEKTSNIVI